MKVLVFHAGHSAAALALVGSMVSALREAGHSSGERFLPSFKAEKEPADRLVVALTGEQAGRYKERGFEMVETFGRIEDLYIKVLLPDDEAEYADFDVHDIVEQVDGPTTPTMDMAQARAEAIERGLEVTPTTTRLELERMLGLDISAARQASDRVSDAFNNQNHGERRIGVRTSQVLPTVNGLDLSRMNDEQLRATATQAGLKVSTNMKRETIINKLTEIFAARVDPTGEAAARSATAATDPGSKDLPSTEHELPSLDGMDVDQLKAQAEQEGVDIGRRTAADSIREAIEVKRQEVKAHG